MVIITLALGILGAWLLPAVSTDRGSPAGNLLSALIASYLGAWAIALVWSRRPREVIVRNLGLASVGLAVAVGLVEGLAALDLVDFPRLFGNPIPEVARPWNQPDPQLIHIHKPGSRLTGQRRGGDLAFHLGAPPWRTYTWDVTMDEQGFRNPPGRRDGHYAMLGDSFVEGIHVKDSDVISAVLESATGRAVLNFGQGAYGPYQERVVLDRFVLARQPRVVIWTFYEGNDLIDLALYRDATRDWEAFIGQFQSLPRRRMFTKNLLVSLGDRLYPPLLRRSARDFECRVRQAGGGDASLYFLYGLGPLTERDMKDVVEFGEILHAAHTALSARGIRLVLAYVPTKFRVYQPYCRIHPGSAIAAWQVNDLPQRIEALASGIAPDIVFVDLTASLRAEAARGELVYFPDDTHWSERGHRVAGEALARALSSAGL